jgi:hypothetical protein
MPRMPPSAPNHRVGQSPLRLVIANLPTYGSPFFAELCNEIYNSQGPKLSKQHLFHPRMLCHCCRNLDLDEMVKDVSQRHDASFDDLRKSAEEGCELCAHILRFRWDAKWDNETVSMADEESGVSLAIMRSFDQSESIIGRKRGISVMHPHLTTQLNAMRPKVQCIFYVHVNN